MDLLNCNHPNPIISFKLRYQFLPVVVRNELNSVMLYHVTRIMYTGQIYEVATIPQVSIYKLQHFKNKHRQAVVVFFKIDCEETASLLPADPV